MNICMLTHSCRYDPSWKKTYYELVVVSLYHVADSKDNVYMCIETFIAKVISSSTIIIDSRFLATPTA